jgi:hypothetical protein
MTAITGFQDSPVRQVRRVVLLMIFALTLLIIFAVSVLHYRPALSAAPGYEMRFVTEPNLWGNPVRAWQRITEQRPCEYQMLGWSPDNQLYYQAACGTQTRAWAYAPNRLHNPAASVPSQLNQEAVSKGQVLDLVRADGVRPIEYESVTRPLLLKSEGYVSPDGCWIAIVTQHIYGLQDIVVLTSN